MKFYSLLFFLLFSCSHLFGFVYKIEEWSNGDSKVILLYDHHRLGEKNNDQISEICNKQRNDLSNFIKMNDGFVIVEDSQMPLSSLDSTIDDPVRIDYSNFFYDQKELKEKELSLLGSPLIGFSSYCFYNKIPHKNIEFRQIKLLSIFNSSIDIKASVVFDRGEKIAEEIYSYDDNEKLNNCYRKVLDTYEKTKKDCLGLFECMSKSDFPLKLLRDKISYEDVFRETLENMYGSSVKDLSEANVVSCLMGAYDVEFIDARIVHTIFTQADSFKHIFVLAGSLHTERVAKVLETLDYKNTVTLGKDYSRDVNSFSQTPLPIDVTHFEPLRELTTLSKGFITSKGAKNIRAFLQNY